MAQAWRLRHRVFNEVLGWGIPDRDLLEIDEFDTTALHCVLLRHEQVVGYLRALPTTEPYLLSKYFPQLVDGPAPSAPDLWEVSRFAVHPSCARAVPIQRQLVKEGVAMTHARGARRLIAVTEPPFARFLSACGLHIDHLCPERVVGQGAHGPVKALAIACAIDTANLEAIGLDPATVPATAPARHHDAAA